MALAQILRLRRKALGLTQRALADRCGLSSRHISHLETCRYQPTLATLDRLAIGLELRLSDLMQETERGMARQTEVTP